jgi:hypothetical protein
VSRPSSTFPASRRAAVPTGTADYWSVPVATLLERLGSTLRGLDAAWLRKPYHWSIVAVRRCMVQFGLISTFFDFVTFGVL